MLSYPEIIQQAAKQYSPALIANYTYDLVKLFNSFYQNVPILGGDKELETFRLSLSSEVAKVIQSGLGLLGNGSSRKNVKKNRSEERFFFS